jgi:transcriptional regulator with XRE-family HTH domain
MGRANVKMTIDGEQYIAIPLSAYRKDFARAVFARPYARGVLGRNLRVARETANLTQTELAAKMGKAQSLVSASEKGTARVGEKYVLAVLAACGLPKDWKAPKPSRKRDAAPPSHSGVQSGDARSKEPRVRRDKKAS